MVYLFLADGFEDIEAVTPVDILRRGDVAVKTVGVDSKVVNSTHGIPVTADITVDEVNVNDIDAIILPGGLPGADNLAKNEKLAEIIKLANKNNKLMCAICAAPSVYGKMGLLEGKNATCYPGFEQYLYGAKLSKDICVKDGNFITANGPGSAAAFGYKILETLTGDKELVNGLISGMLFKL